MSWNRLSMISFHHKYSDLGDKEIIDLIIIPPHDEKAAAYLIHLRYQPLLYNIYNRVFDNDPMWYEDCLSDFFIYLKGTDLDWHKLVTFEWKSTFGAWLNRTAYNRFLYIKPSLIGNGKVTVSLDSKSESKRVIQIPDTSDSLYDNREMYNLMIEAIGLLKDPDQKFVILKRLQGYNSKEIAQLMQKRWEKHGIVKYNNKNQKVVPTAAYVDVIMQRAKDNLEIILKKLL